MEIKNKVKTNWGEVNLIHVSRSPLETLQAMGTSKRSKERLEKELNVKLDVGALRRLEEIKDKLLNSLKESYE